MEVLTLRRNSPLLVPILRVEQIVKVLFPLRQRMLMVGDMSQIECLVTPYLLLWPVVPWPTFRQV